MKSFNCFALNMLFHYSFPVFVSTEKRRELGCGGGVAANIHSKQSVAAEVTRLKLNENRSLLTSAATILRNLQSLAHLFGHQRVNFRAVIFVVGQAFIDLRLGQIGKAAQHVFNLRTVDDQADDIVDRKSTRL